MPSPAGHASRLLPVISGPVSLVSAQGKDLSGLEFLPAEVQGGNFFESIFNGCKITKVQARQSVFQHTEFTEAVIADCLFEDTSFDHSDFVLSTISRTIFVRCSFQNAEWRDATFDGVQFRQCIFRNTTVSLVHFRACEFDDASAANLVGASKRFCLFSDTRFRLPDNAIEFLQVNYGIEGGAARALPNLAGDDPFFGLAVRRYTGQLTDRDFYRLVLAAFGVIASNSPNRERLRLRYLSEICRTAISENLLSVFTIKLLDGALAKYAEGARNGDQGLQIFGLILAVRMALRDRMATIEQELVEVPEFAGRNAVLRLEFENNYSARLIGAYLGQMRSFCDIAPDDLRVHSVEKGSTIVEAVLGATAPLQAIFRFVRYSLAGATTMLSEASRLRRSYQKLRAAGQSRSKGPPKNKRGRPRRDERAAATKNSVDVIVGRGTDETRKIEVFVDQAKEQIFVVGGRVRVTVSYGA